MLASPPAEAPCDLPCLPDEREPCRGCAAAYMEPEQGRGERPASALDLDTGWIALGAESGS